jgi:hypothetical protein
MTSMAIFLSFISVGWTGFTLTAISLPLEVTVAEKGGKGKGTMNSEQ